MSIEAENMIPSTEVQPRATRRRHTAEYKRGVLQEAERCPNSDAVGSLLRREGLYRSQLSEWRKQRKKGELGGLAGKRRGPKPKQLDARDQEISQLKKKLAKAGLRIKQAEALLDLQKKMSEVLGVAFPGMGDTTP
jgi:transposase